MAEILVTGTSGYLGAKIADHLETRGCTVERILGSKEFTQKLAAAKSFQPESVVHAGFSVDYSLVSDLDPESPNLASTRAVIEFCQQQGAQLVFLSAAAVLGVSATPRARAEADLGSCDAGFEPYMRTRYVREKIACEEMIAAANLKGGAILYLTTTYGPDMQAMVTAPLRKIALGAMPVIPAPPGGTSYLLLRDLLAALDAVLAHPGSGSFVVSSGNVSFHDLFKAATRFTGTSWRKQVLPIPARLLPESLVQRDPLLLSSLGYKYYSPAKLGQELGWRPQAGLQDCLRAVFAARPGN